MKLFVIIRRRRDAKQMSVYRLFNTLPGSILMHDLDLALAIRNALLLQFLVILMLPEHAAAAVHLHLQRAWKKIQAPLLQKRQPPKKGSRFWEIDMTKFEP